MEADGAGCWPEEDVFLLLISPHGAVLPEPHPTPMMDARKGAQRQTSGTVKPGGYHLFSELWWLHRLQKGGHV